MAVPAQPDNNSYLDSFERTNSFYYNVILSLPKEESKEAREGRLVLIPGIWLT